MSDGTSNPVEKTKEATTQGKEVELKVKGKPTVIIAAMVLAVILDIGLGFILGKRYAQHVELAVREQMIKHTLDSLKSAYVINDKSKDSVKTQIVTQTNTIIQHEQEVVRQAATIKALPFTKVGPDLKARLEAAQAKPWVVDSAKTK